MLTCARATACRPHLLRQRTTTQRRRGAHLAARVQRVRRRRDADDRGEVLPRAQVVRRGAVPGVELQHERVLERRVRRGARRGALRPAVVVAQRVELLRGGVAAVVGEGGVLREERGERAAGRARRGDGGGGGEGAGRGVGLVFRWGRRIGRCVERVSPLAFCRLRWRLRWLAR